MRKFGTFKLGAILGLALLSLGLSLPAAAQGHGGHGGFGGYHGGGGHGWNGGGWHGGGWHGGWGWRGGPGWRGWGWGWGWPGWGWGWWGPGLAWDWWGYPYYNYPYAYGYPYYADPDQSSAAEPSGPAPPTFWYWCDSAKGYYPNVPQCPEPWREVPATPPAQ